MSKREGLVDTIDSVCNRFKPFPTTPTWIRLNFYSQRSARGVGGFRVILCRFYISVSTGQRCSTATRWVPENALRRRVDVCSLNPSESTDLSRAWDSCLQLYVFFLHPSTLGVGIMILHFHFLSLPSTLYYLVPGTRYLVRKCAYASRFLWLSAAP